jgi:hypothetical protein
MWPERLNADMARYFWADSTAWPWETSPEGEVSSIAIAPIARMRSSMDRRPKTVLKTGAAIAGRP